MDNVKTVYPLQTKFAGGIIITLLHSYVQCVYIVSAKYQIAPSKAVVGVDWPMKAPSMHIKKPYYGKIL